MKDLLFIIEPSKEKQLFKKFLDVPRAIVIICTAGGIIAFIVALTGFLNIEDYASRLLYLLIPVGIAFIWWGVRSLINYQVIKNSVLSIGPAGVTLNLTMKNIYIDYIFMRVTETGDGGLLLKRFGDKNVSDDQENTIVIYPEYENFDQIKTEIKKRTSNAYDTKGSVASGFKEYADHESVEYVNYGEMYRQMVKDIVSKTGMESS
ncbi:hypothetical protein AB9P05_12960 [Roseivirga sp. BDSF3-8]|uniref:hypothetical protein n=1 Tax=Roseivirga sp. BDSF3-8 TaxID=3241598 RepID=UPI0035322B1A